jgi:hypothetical protein
MAYTLLLFMKTVILATRYGLNSPEIEFRWGGVRFTAPVQTGRGSHPASYTMGTGSLTEGRGGKAAGALTTHPHLAARSR